MTMSRSAIFSKDNRYRYLLIRRWDNNRPTLRWIMLNPSVANANRDSKTIKRIMQYTEDLGFGSCIVYNLFALVSPSPSALLTADDPVGPDNDAYLAQCMKNALEENTPVILAWGNVVRARAWRLLQVLKLLKEYRELGVKLYCLGLTSRMQPRHPLGLPDDEEPVMVDWND